MLRTVQFWDEIFARSGEREQVDLHILSGPVYPPARPQGQYAITNILLLDGYCLLKCPLDE